MRILSDVVSLAMSTTHSALSMPDLRLRNQLCAPRMPLVDIVKAGGQEVRIYSALNRGRPYYRLSYCWAGEWKQRGFRIKSPQDEKRARAEAKDIALAMANGRAEGIDDWHEGIKTLRRAQEALHETGVPVDTAAREYAQSWRILEQKAGIVEAASLALRTPRRDQPNPDMETRADGPSVRNPNTFVGASQQPLSRNNLGGEA